MGRGVEQSIASRIWSPVTAPNRWLRSDDHCLIVIRSLRTHQFVSRRCRVGGLYPFS